MNLYLVLFSFIVEIRPDSEYASDERNKHFSFSEKATWKATILVFDMCSTELLPWKNQKGSTRYVNGTRWHFPMNIQFLFGQAISQTTNSKGFLFAYNARLLLFSKGCLRWTVTM